MAFKGIILDFDGTLVDTEPLYFRANREAFAHFGHTIDENEYYHYWSLMGSGIRGEIERYGLGEIDIEQLKSISRNCYKLLIESEPIALFPYARELLIALPKAGFQVLIASNTPQDLIQRILARAGFQAPPVPILGGDSFRSKPAPDIFLAAVDQTGLDKSHCLILEDTDKGVRAARAAGIPFAIIHSSLYPEYHPDDAVAKFPDLNEFFKFVTKGSLSPSGGSILPSRK